MKPKWTDAEHVDSDLIRLIETGNTTEQISARMLKTMVPMIKEVLESGDLSNLSGFVNGLCQIAASVVISLPPHMRQGIADILKHHLEQAMDLAVKGPPKEFYHHD